MKWAGRQKVVMVMDHHKKQTVVHFFAFSILLTLIMCMSMLINCRGTTVIGSDQINYTHVTVCACD